MWASRGIDARTQVQETFNLVRSGIRRRAVGATIARDSLFQHP
jgi:hypothetical protein